MKVVITGALGHIGSRLVRTVTSDMADELVLIDDLSTHRYCSLFDLATGVPTRFVEADICSAALEEEFDSAGLVIHLAAITDAMGTYAHQEAVMRVNVEGTGRVARAAAASGARMVFVSTTSVYGTQNLRVDEHCAVSELNPQSPYAESKLFAERVLSEVAAECGLEYVTLRLGTIFGPSIGMRFHTAINKFVWLACTNRPVTVWQTAMEQVRPYLHLEDAVRAIWFAARLARREGDNVYNVLTANASVRQILDIIRVRIPEFETTFVSSPIMNQLSFEVSPDRFRATGFEYRGSLQAGIADTIRVFAGLTQSAAVAASA